MDIKYKIIFSLFLFCYPSCSCYPEFIEMDIEPFSVTLLNGENGSNIVLDNIPQFAWEAVEGAKYYNVIIQDYTIANNLKQTEYFVPQNVYNFDNTLIVFQN